MRVEIFRGVGKLPRRLAVLLAIVHSIIISTTTTTTKQYSLGVVAAAIVGSEKQEERKGHSSNVRHYLTEEKRLTQSIGEFEKVNTKTTRSGEENQNAFRRRYLDGHQAFQFSSSAHACLLAYDIVQCVGYNYYGQLGQSSSTAFGTPVQLMFPGVTSAKPIKVVTGYDHTCTLFNNGHVWCNGSNGFEQLGNGGTVNSEIPVQVKDNNSANLANVIDIEAGAYHNCAIQNSGAIYCWGFNTDVQLGLNSLADGLDQATSVVLVALSMSATCAITASDATKVQCVGYGYSSSDNASTTIDLGHAVTVLTAGSTHFCALLDTTKAKCWGTNHKGQLGIGSAEFTSAYMNTPVFVLQDSIGTELSGITDINAAHSSTCLIASGKPMCFGNNRWYQLGIANGGAKVLYPTLVTPFDSITGKTLLSMHVGEYTGHAVFDDDSVYSVGTNNGGTFGDGSAISSKNVVGDVSSAIAKQISFINGSSSPSSIPSNSPSSIPSDLPSLSPSSIPSDLPSLSPSSNPFFDGVQLTGYTTGQCIGYDGYKDLFMHPCTGNVAQKFALASNGLIIWGGLDNMCLLADGLMWPKLRACDVSNQNQLWTYENGQFKTAGGTKCLGIFDNSNRLKVDDCASVSSTWYD